MTSSRYAMTESFGDVEIYRVDPLQCSEPRIRHSCKIGARRDRDISGSVWRDMVSGGDDKTGPISGEMRILLLPITSKW
jgi:hypothetical protein